MPMSRPNCEKFENNGSTISVTKLNNQNYQIWKFKIKMLLLNEGKWNIISKPKPEPVTKDWIEKDQLVQIYISFLVEDNQIIHICNCTSAKEMWETLQMVHEKLVGKKLYLLRKYYQSKLETGQDMQDYINKTLEKVTSLRSDGEEIKDLHVIAVLLSGLPKDYENLVKTFDMLPDDELTLEFVKEKLLEGYKRKSKSNKENRVLSQSGTYKNVRFTTGSNEPRIRGKIMLCFFCQKPGHFKKDCELFKAKISKN